MAVAAALAAATTPTAVAAPSPKKAIWGPVTRHGVSQFPIYRALGVGILELDLNWDAVAPTRPADRRNPADPAYRWPADVDEAVAQGAANGIQILLMVSGTPGWANGGRDHRWAPNDPEDYADFLEAASHRWPTVKLWMIWGEPTKAANFQPLPSDHGRPLRGSGLRGPRTYARLLDAAYARLKALSPTNLVIGGNSYTVGSVRPLYWIRALRLPDGRVPRMDLYGHNPFSLRRPTLRASPLGHGYADFGDLDTLARALDRHLRQPGQRHGPRIFISEYSLPTDHSNFEFNFYVSRSVQAQWLADALRVARGWSRIYSFGYLGLYDDRARPDGRQVERGLMTRSGTRKPAFDAYAEG